MPQDMQHLDQKIAELKAKKDQLKAKNAQLLYRKLETLLGADFTPEIVLAIVTWAKENHGQTQQEVWAKMAPTFQRSRKPKGKAAA